MGIKFINSKKKDKKDDSIKKGTINPNGPVEIVSKNFTMTTNPNTKKLTSDDYDMVNNSVTWICWGCGHSNSGDTCSVCGKKKIK